MRLLCNTGNSQVLCDNLEGWDWGRLRRRIYIYIIIYNYGSFLLFGRAGNKHKIVKQNQPFNKSIFQLLEKQTNKKHFKYSLWQALHLAEEEQWTGHNLHPSLKCKEPLHKTLWNQKPRSQQPSLRLWRQCHLSKGKLPLSSPCAFWLPCCWLN